MPVTWAHLPGDLYGLWTGHEILLDPRLTSIQARSTLAHEIVHAELDQPLLHESYAARVEARADRIAAQRLISPDEYAAACNLYEHQEQIANELGVTLDILTAYQRTGVPQ